MNLTPENPPPPDPEFVELVQRVIDHEASLEDIARLNAVLPSDPAALRYFVKMRMLHVALEDEFGASSSELDSIKGRLTTSRASSSSAVPAKGGAVVAFPAPARDGAPVAAAKTGAARRRWFAAAAVFLLASLAAFWGGKQLLGRPAAFEIVARYGTGSSVPPSGSWINYGEQLRVKQGAVELRSANGNSLTLEGPGDLTIRDAHTLTLGSGKLWSVINGDPVRIRTPQGDITDLGTTFGIDQSSQEATRVDVFDGRVQFADPADSSRRVEAAAGKGLVREGAQWPPETADADLSRYTAGLRSPLGIVFVRDEAEGSRIASALPLSAQWTPVSTPAGKVRPKGASFEVAWAGSSLGSSGGNESVEAALFHTHLQATSDDFAAWKLVTSNNHLDSATGWTWETRFRIDSANDANRGVWEIYLRDNDNGSLAATRIHFLATGLDRDNAGFGVDAEIAADLTDDFHVVRGAVEGGTNLTTVWLDGIKVIDALPSNTFDAGEQGVIGRWGAHTRGGTTTIDYIRFDTTGAYSPVSDRSHQATRDSTDFTSTIDQIEGDVDPVTLGSFGPHSTSGLPATVVNGDGTVTVTLPQGPDQGKKAARNSEPAGESFGVTIRLHGMSAWLGEIGAKAYRITLLRNSGVDGVEFLPVTAYAGEPSADSYLAMLQLWDKDYLAASFPDAPGGEGARAMGSFKAPFTADHLTLTIPPPSWSRVKERTNVSALLVTPVF